MTENITSQESARRAIAEVLKNVNAEIKKIEGVTMAGLFAAGLKVQALAQKRVPVEHGFLRASAYTRKTANGKGVEVGFSAAYAVYVHENMEQKLKGQPRPSGLGVYWGPDGQPKFLESALRDTPIVSIVTSYSKQGAPN